MRLLGKAGDTSHEHGHDNEPAHHEEAANRGTTAPGNAAEAKAAGARDTADARGKRLDLDAAATSRTADDRDTDLSAPSPDAGPDSPAELKGKGVLGALKRTFKQFSQDNVTDWAAALTYYGVLSIFPGALVLVSILGMLSSDGQRTVQETVQEVAPSEQIQTLVGQVLTQVQDPGTAGLAAIIGIAAAFWSASGYIGAFMRASNSIYDVPEGRPIWKTLPIRLGVTAVIGVMLVLSAFIVVFTGDLARVVGDKIGLGEAAVTTWNIAKWPVLVVIVSLMFAILYWASPNAKTGGFRWVSPGGVFAVLVWVAASAAFAIYLANFANYNKTYGTLGGVIAFLVWLWISNIAIMLGAELDAELERGRAIAAGHSPDDEPFLQLRDDRKLKKGSEKGLSTS
ncbi:YihY/virulence factor BrkB family protein [Couchioplanes caeruleus]|uniref:Ribonuclease BN n=2 Tax=Couchioplanes caeruleus TaxID=56438 RepID=A0A1K0FWC2_9ACTN|nr:YihY/virulence factor BrkB family protein [Couchioplanes caeruleus]OJF09370.1 ribonuclease BN [Couchioplanes caeruleus subsp. caeruleus]ROP29550.1 membrane protein [Couchioplanes caeruleus]